MRVILSCVQDTEDTRFMQPRCEPFRAIWTHLEPFGLSGLVWFGLVWSGLVWSGWFGSGQNTTLFQLQTCLLLFIQTLTTTSTTNRQTDRQTKFFLSRPVVEVSLRDDLITIIKIIILMLIIILIKFSSKLSLYLSS